MVLRTVSIAGLAGLASGLALTSNMPLPQRALFASSSQHFHGNWASVAPTLGRRSAQICMQQVEMDDATLAFYSEYQQSDAETGEAKSLELGEKEKLYLECIDAFYNEGGKQILSDDDYTVLKRDLDFSGSKLSTFSRDEINFILANKRFSMGKPILSDTEYDQLRAKLKAAGSAVILHDAPRCDIDTGICKMDLKVDTAKMRLLYLPGVGISSIIGCEICFWTLGIDPFLAIILTIIPSFFVGKWFTENVFATDPLPTQTSCPNCDTLVSIYFGDLFSVQQDGIIGQAGPPGKTVTVQCPNCKSELLADREEMVVSTTKK